MGLTIEAVMYGLKMHESGGDYTAQNRDTTASGAYQYLDSTWGNYGGYARAKYAPRSVQDERVRRDLTASWARFGDWEKCLCNHFYPPWANDKSKWNLHPTPNNPTVWSFVNDVMRRAAAYAGEPASGGEITGEGSPPPSDGPPKELIIGVGVALGALVLIMLIPS
jgi:hypothetical protein